MLRLLAHHAGAQQHHKDVRQRHERVGDVGCRPGHIADAHAAQKAHADIEAQVQRDPAAAEQVQGDAFAVIAPTDDGGIGEAQDAQHENGRAHVGDGGEHGVGKRGAVGDAGILDERRVGAQRRNDDQGCHEADDHRAPKRAGHGHERLARGVLRLGGGADERSRTQARLVREQAARTAELQRHDDAASHRTAEGRARGEGTFEDQPERLADERPVANEDIGAAQNVRDAHDGHELLADVGDGSQAAHDDEQGATAHDGGDDPGLHAEVRLRNRGDGAGLHSRSDSEDSKACHDGEPDGHELRPPRNGAVGTLVALLPHVHGAAHHVALAVLHAVLHGRVDLGVLRCHAQDTREPHPQHRTRAAGEHCRGHADDGTRSQRGGKRGGHGAEVADIALSAVVLRDGKLEGQGQFSLDALGADGGVNVAAQQQDDHRRPPNGGVYAVEHFDVIHAKPRSLKDESLQGRERFIIGPPSLQTAEVSAKKRIAWRFGRKASPSKLISYNYSL